MKKRFKLACRTVFAISVGILLILAFPVWGLIWIITGWDYQMWMNRYLDPEWADKMDEIKKQGEKGVAEWEKFNAEMEFKTAKYKKEISDYEDECRQNEMI